MEKKSYCLAFLAFCLFLSACAPSSLFVVPTQTPTIPPPTYTSIPTSTATPISTSTTAPTAVPTATKSPLPTIVKHRPTPTVERPVEWDINPIYEKKIDTEWKGVRIKASILIDESLKDRVVSIDMMDSLLAEIVARTIFVAWYSQYCQVVWDKYYSSAPGNRELYYDDAALDSFMELWSKAQKSGESSDWRKVQINNIRANDLTDGNGYFPQPYIFWPMYEGEVPSNVKAIEEFTYVFTDTTVSNNLVGMRYSDDTVIKMGFGKNINENKFLFMMGTYFNKARFEAGTSISIMESFFEDETALYYFGLSGYYLLFLNTEKYINPKIFFIDEAMYKSINHWGIKIKLTPEE